MIDSHNKALKRNIILQRLGCGQGVGRAYLGRLARYAGKSRPPLARSWRERQEWTCASPRRYLNGTGAAHRYLVASWTACGGGHRYLDGT